MIHDVPSTRRTSVLDRIEHHLREIVGDSGTIERWAMNDDWEVIDVVPIREGARAVTVSAEDRLIVMLGDETGHFALTYDDDGVALAHDLIEAVIAGRVTEWPSPLGTRVSVQLADGHRVARTAVGVLPVFFGSRRNFPRRQYTSY